MTNIEFLRKQCNLSRPQLSELIDVPVRTIENWEYGTTKPAEYVENMVIDKLKELTKKSSKKIVFNEEIDHSPSLTKSYLEDDYSFTIINNKIYDSLSLVNICIFEITNPNGSKEYIYPSETHIYNIDSFLQYGEIRIFDCLISIDKLIFDYSTHNLSYILGQIIHYRELKGYEYQQIMKDVHAKQNNDLCKIFKTYCLAQ